MKGDAIDCVRADPLALARVYMQLGNTFYRFHDHKSARRFLEQGKGHFVLAQNGATEDREHRSIGIERLLNEIWIGRLEMRGRGGWMSVGSHLGEATDFETSPYDSPVTVANASGLAPAD